MQIKQHFNFIHQHFIMGRNMKKLKFSEGGKKKNFVYLLQKILPTDADIHKTLFMYLHITEIQKCSSKEEKNKLI